MRFVQYYENGQTVIDSEGYIFLDGRWSIQHCIDFAIEAAANYSRKSFEAFTIECGSIRSSTSITDKIKL